MKFPTNENLIKEFSMEKLYDFIDPILYDINYESRATFVNNIVIEFFR